MERRRSRLTEIGRHLRQHWIAALLLLLLLLYAVSGALILPALGRRALVRYAAEHGLTAELQTLRFNPFTFRASLDHLLIRDLNQQPMIRAAALEANMQLASLWERAVVFSRLAASRPEFHLRRTSSGDWNIAALLRDKKPAPDPAGNIPGQPAKGSTRVVVADARIAQGAFTFADESRPHTFDLALSDIAFEISGLDTRSGEYLPFSFAARTASEERLVLHGQAALQPMRLAAAIEIDGLELPKVAEYFRESLPWQLTSGTARARAQLELEPEAAPLKLHLRVDELTINSARFAAPDGSEELAAFGSFALKGGDLRLPERSVRIEAVMSQHGVFVGRRKPGASGYQTVASGFGAPRGGAAQADTGNQGGVWYFDAKNVRLADYKIIHEDLTVEPPLRLESLLAASASGLSSVPGRRFGIELNVSFGGGGKVEMKGGGELQPFSASVEARLDSLSLAQFQSYISQAAAIHIADGSLAAAGRLDAGASSPFIRFQGDAALEHLQTRTAADEEYFSLERAQAKRIEYTSDPARLRIADILLSAPKAALIKNADGSLQLGKLAGSGSSPEIEKTGGDQPGDAAKPDYAFEKLRLEQGTLRFIDRSTEPAVELILNDVNGEAAGFSAADPRPVDAQLSARLTPNAPLNLQGKLDLTAKPYFDLFRFELDGAYLPGLSPYIARYAGRRVREGTLNLKLDYQSKGTAIEGKNGIVLERLEFGERVETKDALGIPLELAAAILRDQEGRIRLDFPVAGDLNEPRASFSGIILRALKNVLASILASPFNLLASLAGTKQDLGRCHFSPGEAVLIDEEQTRLGALADALSKRPALALQVVPMFAVEQDQRALAKQKLLDQLFAGERGEGEQAPASLASASREQKQRYVKRLVERYRKQFGAEPAAGTAGQKPPEGEAQQFVGIDASYSPALLAGVQELLLQSTTVDPEELQKLAKERGRVVVDYITRTGKIDPARIKLLDVSSMRFSGSRVFLPLSLDAAGQPR